MCIKGNTVKREMYKESNALVKKEKRKKERPVFMCGKIKITFHFFVSDLKSM